MIITSYIININNIIISIVIIIDYKTIIYTCSVLQLHQSVRFEKE